MLIGPWKSFEELEENVSLNELQLIVKAIYEQEHRAFRRAASLKGIQLDDEPASEDAQTRFERAQERANKRLSGMSDEEIARSDESAEFGQLGFALETE